MLIDTHTHLHFNEFQADFDEVIQRALNSGVEKIITLGTTYSSSMDALKLARKYDGIYSAAGIHPTEAHLTKPNDINRIKDLAKSETKIVAIGEIGLDFFWNKSNAKEQYEVFGQMIQIGKELNLPVSIHSRSAQREMQWFFQEEEIFELVGVMHCFEGDKIDAQFFLDMGLHISFTGNITYHNFKKVDVVKYVPIDRILLETDSPYMAPEPHKKKRNEPAFVPLIAKKLSEIHKKPLSEIERITSENAQRLFNLV